MTKDEFARLIEERGGLAGEPPIVDPLIDNPDPIDRKLNPKIPNPNPRRTYIFNNGTQLEARGQGDETDAEGHPLEIQITDAGTALKPSAATSLEEGVSTPTDQRFIISRKPDGTLTQKENPNYKGDKDEKSQLQPFGDQLLRVAPDGTVTVIANKSADAKQPTTIPFGDTLYSFDGTKVTPLITKPKEPEKPLTEVRNGRTYQWNPSTQSWAEAPGLPTEDKPKTMTGAGTQSEWLIVYDSTTGQEVGRERNPNYRPPSPTLPAQSANAPMVPIEDPEHPGQIKWVPNQGQVMAGEALQALAAQLSNTVVDPNHPLTMDQAKALIEAANNRLTTETQQAQVAAQKAQTAAGAAQNILSTQAQGAQTGAGMLQQRATTAQNLVQQGLNVATSAGGRYGNYSGGMLSPVPGLGQGLVQGAAGFATELGGGQAVYDTAVRMVQAADPSNSNPDRAAAVATLTQLMDRYQQASGQDHPAVAATKALQASNAGGGLAAPQTINPAAVSPEVFQAQFDPRFNPAAPQQPPNTLLPAGIAGTVAPGDPRYVGTLPTTAPRTAAQLGFTAPGAMMGMVGPMAMAASR